MEQSVQPITFLKQTRLNTGNLPHQRGNSFPTAIACLMGLTDPETVFQVQEVYDRDQPGDPDNWVFQLRRWLAQRSLQWTIHEDHLHDDQPYLVAGKSTRGNTHVCIYRNGKLLHDPHPDRTGLLTEDSFEIIEPLALIP